MLSDHLPKGNAVLDASVIINLLGCGEPARVLSALGYPCIVETRTLREIRRHPEPGRSHETILQDLVSRELLVVVRMTDEEYENYLGYVQGPLASRLDDGESAAIALAGRGACLILDERKARRRVATELPEVSVRSSLQLMLTSACRGGWKLEEARDCVQMAIRHARMGVPREDVSLLKMLLDEEGKE